MICWCFLILEDIFDKLVGEYVVSLFLVCLCFGFDFEVVFGFKGDGLKGFGFLGFGFLGFGVMGFFGVEGGEERGEFELLFSGSLCFWFSGRMGRVCVCGLLVVVFVWFLVLCVMG